jgi:hypothetical protein
MGTRARPRRRLRFGALRRSPRKFERHDGAFQRHDGGGHDASVTIGALDAGFVRHRVSIGSTARTKGTHDLDIEHHFRAYVDHLNSIVSPWVCFERHDRDFVLHDREKAPHYLSIVRPLKAFVTHDRNLVTPFRANVVHDVSKEQRFEEHAPALVSKMVLFRSKVSPLRFIVPPFRNKMSSRVSFSR